MSYEEIDEQRRNSDAAETTDAVHGLRTDASADGGFNSNDDDVQDDEGEVEDGSLNNNKESSMLLDDDDMTVKSDSDTYSRDTEDLEEEENDDDDDDDDDEGRGATRVEMDDSFKTKPSMASQASPSSKKGRSPSVAGLTIPFRTVKKAMKLDPDTPIVQNEAAVMVTYVSELFLKNLAKQSFQNAKNKARHTVRYEDIAEARTNDPTLSFLEMLLP